MSTIAVTSGERFTDIDALACAIAYAELLRLEGKAAEAVLPGVLNSSCTAMVRAWPLEYRTAPSADVSGYVVEDVSEPAHIAVCATPEKIVELYDHHFGFQDMWRERLGAHARIEHVGACATLIWEEYKKRGFAERISPLCANLLAVAIISNTLNFGAQVTDARDVVAFEELKARIAMPPGWESRYFRELQEENLHGDAEENIKSDTKVIEAPGHDPMVMGQMELWDGREFIPKHKAAIDRVLGSFGVEDWFMSVPSISERKNYLYAPNAKMRDLLGRLIGASFKGDVGETDKLWLRKEIRKMLLEE